MAIVKVSITLQSASDVDALLAKRGVTLKDKSAKTYDIDVVGGVLKLVTWDTDLGATPTQQDIDSLQAADRTTATTEAHAITLKAESRLAGRLADFAMMRIAVDAPTWDALKTADKVAAVLADADLWVQTRQLLESGL